MATFVLATVIFMILFAGMAVGVIFSNKPIKGTCGGLNNIGLGKGECEICGGNREKCDEVNAENGGENAVANTAGSTRESTAENARITAAPYYDATRKP